MNRITAYFLMSLFLSGCDLLPTVSENEPEEKSAQLTTDENNQAFMKIAKDLYAAKQYKQAMQIAQRLADQGNHEAQYLLGYLMYYGHGVSANKELGTKWIQMAADAGYRPAIEGLVMIRHQLTSNTCDSVPLKTEEKTDAVESSSDERVIITPQGQKKYPESAE